MRYFVFLFTSLLVSLPATALQVETKSVTISTEIAKPLMPVVIKSVETSGSLYFKRRISSNGTTYLVGIPVSFIEEPACRKFAGFRRIAEADVQLPDIGTVPAERIELLSSVEELRRCPHFEWQARRLITIEIPERGRNTGGKVVRFDSERGSTSYLVTVSDGTVTLKPLN